MPISNSTFPRCLTEIDELTRPDHHWLTPDDKCFFIGEYTARKGFSFSETNSVILNFKKSLDRRGKAEWPYKQKAIMTAASAFGAAIPANWITGTTFVPIPPSRAKTDPFYDDRLLRMLRSIPAAVPLDIRELIVQPQSMEAVHDADVRPTPDEIAAGYRVDENLAHPAPIRIAIVDDVMTTGAHYVAARRVLGARFPQVRSVGFFIARRAPETTDFSAFFDEIEDI